MGLLLISLSVIFLLLDISYYCYDIIPILHNRLSHHLFDLLTELGIYRNCYIAKSLSVVFLFLFIMNTNPTDRKHNIYLQLFAAVTATGIMVIANHLEISSVIYIILISISYITLYIVGTTLPWRFSISAEEYNDIEDTIQQERRLISNKYSINIPTRFKHKGRRYKGWINVINPFRATMILGTPGSGKSYAVYYPFIRQMIEKGYAMYVYDYKYPDLSKIVYNILLKNQSGYKIAPKFYVINFDDPSKSNRCNPLNPAFMTDIADAYESSYTILLNLNRSWAQKQGDFFVESAYVYFAALIWYLKIYKNGIYCTLPHALVLLTQPYKVVFDILQSYPELKSYLVAFINAMEEGAMEQFQGQIASAIIPLTRLNSPALFWVMSGDDFSLDINNPSDPKILCVANNPDRQSIYGAALALYNARLLKIINKKGQLHCGVLLDELPTMFVKGLDNTIATARSNKVAIVAGAQDFSQIIRDYTEQEAKVIINTVGNVISGQVRGDTARLLADMFGKEFRERESRTYNQDSRSFTLNLQQEDIIPQSTIATLSQGQFVGVLSDNVGQKTNNKFFHCEIVVDVEERSNEEKNYVPIPPLCEVEGGDIEQLVRQNYKQIYRDIEQLIMDELEKNI